jgi:voltage-gated potassium channel
MTHKNKFRQKIHEVIFESDTKHGKIFDLSLFWAIIASVIVVMLDSVKSLNQQYHLFFNILEIFFTVIFTIEYISRIYVIKLPMKYVTSFMGVIDLLAILPSYLVLFIPGSHYLITIRTLRLIRIFRILKLGRYLKEAQVITNALKASRPKITVFLVAVISIVIVMGTIMYQVEGEKNGFTSIPRSIYWAVVTLTTVGYGDIAPKTVLGQFIASAVMIMGYSIIAIPTGIITSEITNAQKNYKKISTQSCPACSLEGHDFDAKFCKFCGGKL